MATIPTVSPISVPHTGCQETTPPTIPPFPTAHIQESIMPHEYNSIYPRKNRVFQFASRRRANRNARVQPTPENVMEERSRICMKNASYA